MSKNPYQENGFENRFEYLKSLSEDFGIDLDVVLALADLLGPNEDFDGLISELEDLSGDF
jgi:hypothetical protein